MGENSGVFIRNVGKGNINFFYLRYFKIDWVLCIFFLSIDSLYLFFMLYYNEIGRVYKYYVKDEVFKF